jgi:hypothetical protein
VQLGSALVPGNSGIAPQLGGCVPPVTSLDPDAACGAAELFPLGLLDGLDDVVPWLQQ